MRSVKRLGIMVMNTPGGNTVSTAQLAVSLLCSLARNIPAADMSVKDVSVFKFIDGPTINLLHSAAHFISKDYDFHSTYTLTTTILDY